MYRLLLFFFAGILAPLPAYTQSTFSPSRLHPELVQVSTYPALQMGMFNGNITYGQLEQMGDFGIGTFNGMDGEMVALDGKFYQAKTDGSVLIADTAMKTPFALVHFFQSKHEVHKKGSINSYDLLKIYLTDRFPTRNNPAAFKITGVFTYLKLRSVPRQSEPFPPLSEVVAQQAVFELHTIKGTLVGYRIPEYLADLNVPGYHLHFISDDRQHAGHMLECALTDVIVNVDELESVTFLIPQTENFQKADFTKRQK